MYRHGKGVPQDHAEAVKWYRLAAEQGHVQAQTNLDVMYENGDGVGDWSVQNKLLHCESAYRLSTGETLAPEEIPNAAICAAFVRGIAGVLAYNCASREDGYLPLFAAEPAASVGAAIQAFINWAKANPDAWGLDAQEGVILALMETFPCPMP